MCAFCESEARLRSVIVTEHFYVIEDRAPVTEGHMLVISKAHRAHLFELTRHEWDDLGHALECARDHMHKVYDVSQCNVGTNVGEYAGQTVMHFHVHMIPRRKGDVENPRGGVRNLMKPLRELVPE